MGDDGFWDDDGRVAILGEVELRDRIEAGLRTAGSLLGRLRSTRRAPSTLVRRAAQRLLLLDLALDALAAGEPADAVIAIEASAAAAAFAERIATMYRGWARERGMSLEPLEESTGNKGFKLRLAVGGFGALQVLRAEAGLHVLEVPDGKGGFLRRRVRVTIEPGEPSARIVRRYRERPTPLVRDAVRGWRTGRLDAVLAGGFDLVE